MDTPVLDPRPGRTAGYALFAVLAGAAFWAAGGYVARFGNPLVASDAWYFLDVFLQPAMESGASLADYYAKREAMDHAQPLNKLLLLANARWFGLDFVAEAFIGLAFALAALALVAWTTRADRGLQPPWLRGVLLGGLAAVLVTLNSGTVFDWSLVTLNYVFYFAVLVAALAAWRMLQRGAWWPLALAAFVVAAAFDGIGLAAGIVLVGALAWAGLRPGAATRALRAAAVVVAAQVAFRLAAHWLLPGVPGPEEASSSWAALAGLGGGWLEVVRIVLGSTIAHLHQLQRFSPEGAEAIQGWLAVLALLAHAWFWWRARRGPANLAAFYAVVMMLLFYALAAAIVYARVPLNGVGYLHQTRYVGIYLLANVAIVLMLLAQPLVDRRARTMASGGLALLLGLQVLLATHTWREGGHLHPYYHKMAIQTLALGAAPDEVPADCLALVHVCEFDAATRRKVTAFLARHRLNVYSPAFAKRYGLGALLEHYVPAAGGWTVVGGTGARVRVRVRVRLDGDAAPREAAASGGPPVVDIEVEVEPP